MEKLETGRAPRARSPHPLLFTNVRIFDGTGRAPFPGSVRVEANRIARVTPGTTEHAPDADADVIDGQGATLMPGLIESHAHLSFPSSTERIVDAMVLPAEEHLLITAYNARRLLDAGFTSAYSAGSIGARFEIALRKEIDGGYLPGPRLRASSIETAPKAPPGVPSAKDPRHARGADAIRDYIRAKAADGVDSIKFLLSGDEAFEQGGAQKLTYSEAEIVAATETARECGIFLACHAQAATAVKLAARHGFRSIYHCSYADEEALDLLEARKDEIFVSPAAGMLYARAYEAEAFGIDRATAERMGAFSGLALMATVIPQMRKRGIRVLPGGDYGFPYNPIGRNARDLEHFVTLFGYTPTEALVAATKLGGELMGQGDALGLIEPGYLADLLMIDGDPTDDVRILQDAASILAIVKDGAFHKAPPTQR